MLPDWTSSEEEPSIDASWRDQGDFSESDPNWIWFHADKFPSGHAIIETNSPTKQEIIQVSLLVKNRCKLKHYHKGKIINCPVKNLTQTGIPGEVNLKRRPNTVIVQENLTTKTLHLQNKIL